MCYFFNLFGDGVDIGQVSVGNFNVDWVFDVGGEYVDVVVDWWYL